MPERFVVLGGGLAGVAAALQLADAGHQVSLVEARGWLGGAAFSFRRGDLDVDNGQHVFLRCCTEYRSLLARIGATELTHLQPRLDITVLAPGGRRARIARTPGVPAPAHLAAALARYRLLPLADRARVGRAVIGLLASDPADPTLDAYSFGQFLHAHGQSDTAIRRFWGIIATATLNADPADGSHALATMVFRTGLLDRADAADVGYAAVPLRRIHHGAAADALTAAGVELLLGHRALDVRPDRVVVRARGRERSLRADGVLLAVPPPGLVSRFAPRCVELGAAPIVNVHVVYDRRVTELPFAAAVDSPVQWFFDRTEASGLAAREPRQQYLAVTLSAADAIVERRGRELIEQYTAALAELLPQARRAHVVQAFVTRERRATFRQAPGTARLRPPAGIVQEGIALAGSWTATGWPDTMESAVRSGRAAAASLMAGLPAQASRVAVAG